MDQLNTFKMHLLTVADAVGGNDAGGKMRRKSMCNGAILLGRTSESAAAVVMPMPLSEVAAEAPADEKSRAREARRRVSLSEPPCRRTSLVQRYCETGDGYVV